MPQSGSGARKRLDYVSPRQQMAGGAIALLAADILAGLVGTAHSRPSLFVMTIVCDLAASKRDRSIFYRQCTDSLACHRNAKLELTLTTRCLGAERACT